MYNDLTLEEFLSGSFDFGCKVAIYDCTNYNCWLDSPYSYDIDDVPNELLNAKIQYFSINGRTIIIEVSL